MPHLRLTKKRQLTVATPKRVNTGIDTYSSQMFHPAMRSATACSIRRKIARTSTLFHAQTQGIVRIDRILKRFLAIQMGNLINLADPVVDHRLGAVVPGIIERGSH